MLHLRKLPRDSALPLLVAKTENIDSDTAAQINVFAAVRAVNRGTLAAGDLQRETVVGVRDVLPVKLLGRHENASVM